MRDLTEASNNIAAKRGQLKQENHDRRFSEAIDRLGKKSLAKFLNASTPRTQAAQACEALTRTERDAHVLTAMERAYRLAAEHFQAKASEIGERLSRLHECRAETGVQTAEAWQAATSSTDSLRSIVQPDETVRFLKQISESIDIELGDPPAPLTPARLMQHGLDDTLAEFSGECGLRYDSFLRNHLKSLSGAAAFGGLRWSLSEWTQGALGKLILPVPLDFLAIGGAGNAPRHLYIAAGGDDYIKLQEMKGSRPKLKSLSVIDSGDSFFVVVRQRIAGLPFATLPVASYLAAAECFEEDDQKIAVNRLEFDQLARQCPARAAP